MAAHRSQGMALRPEWLLAIAGLVVMYLPTYWSAAHVVWSNDDQAHGPIILAVAVWLFWRVAHMVDQSPTAPSPLLGWPIFLFGVLMYVLGRSLAITSVEFASHLPVFL